MEAAQELSPLLAQPPQFVRVHFEVHADGRIESPQTPAGDAATWATGHGARPETIAAAGKSLAELRPALRHADLLALLPEHSPLVVAAGQPPPSEPPVPQVAAQPSVPPANPNPVIDNSYSALSQQLKQQQDAQVAQQPIAPQVDDAPSRLVRPPPADQASRSKPPSSRLLRASSNWPSTTAISPKTAE